MKTTIIIYSVWTKSGDNIYKNNIVYVGIGKHNPSTILDVNGTIMATAFNGALSGNASTANNLTGNTSISVSGINLNSGNITNGNQISASDFYGYLNGNISGSSTSCSGNAATASSCSGNSASTNILNGTTDVWHTSTEGILKFYFSSSSHTYFCTGASYIFRQADTTTDCCQIDSNGIKASVLSVSITNTNMCCVQQNQVLGNHNYNTIRIAYNTFTGFHHCFIDDVLFHSNNNQQFKDE